MSSTLKLVVNVMVEGKLNNPRMIRSRLTTVHRFVEFETSVDLRTACEKLDNTEFKGQTVRCTANVSGVKDTVGISNKDLGTS